MLVTSGSPPHIRISYGNQKVHNVSPEQAILLVGDGQTEENPAGSALLTATGILSGRVAFTLGENIRVKTPIFDFDASNTNQFRFNELQFDESDPGGIQPWYGPSTEVMNVLHVTNPADPQLDTFWFYQTALEVLVEENSFSFDSSPYTPVLMNVCIVSYDALGDEFDRVDKIELTRFDYWDDDLEHVSYRSSVDRPLIFVDTEVDKEAFPDLYILRVADGGFVWVLQ